MTRLSLLFLALAAGCIDSVDSVGGEAPVQGDGLLVRGDCDPTANANGEPANVGDLIFSPPAVTVGTAVVDCSALAARSTQVMPTWVSEPPLRDSAWFSAQNVTTDDARGERRCVIRTVSSLRGRKDASDDYAPLPPFPARAQLCRAEVEVPRDVVLSLNGDVRARVLLSGRAGDVSLSPRTLDVVAVAEPSGLSRCAAESDDAGELLVDAFTGDVIVEISIDERDLPQLTTAALGATVRVGVAVAAAQ